MFGFIVVVALVGDGLLDDCFLMKMIHIQKCQKIESVFNLIETKLKTTNIGEMDLFYT